MLCQNTVMTIISDNFTPEKSGFDLEKFREQSKQADEKLIQESGHTPPDPPDYYGTSWTECLDNPEPIEWFIDGWVQSKALNMVFGPSGGGKTFLVLHWCLSMAAGLDSWAGNEISPGAVVYLAGEGHQGLKGRIAAWLHDKQITNPDPDNFTFTNRAADLNTPEGYETVASFLRGLRKAPRLIVVDTTNLHFSGNENAANEVRTMINNCRRLIREFDAAVLLVHHTGVSQEAKGRVRGSSAWKASMDIEIEVQPLNEDSIGVYQTKSKDSKPADPVFIKINPAPWYDKDGNEYSSAVIALTSAPEKSVKIKRLSGHGQQAWQAFKSALASEESIRDESGNPLGVHIEVWRKYFYEISMADEQNAKKTAFQRARKTLIEMEYLSVKNDVYQDLSQLNSSQKKDSDPVTWSPYVD